MERGVAVLGESETPLKERRELSEQREFERSSFRP